MKIEIKKDINVKTVIDSDDMGVAFAVAAQDEKISFIEAMVTEFNLWDSFDKDMQIQRIVEEVAKSKHSKEIVEFFERVADFYKYHTEESTTVFLP